MELKVNINDELLKKIVAMALEECSREWYVLNPEDIEVVRKTHHPDLRDKLTQYQMIANAVVSKNFNLPIMDFNDEDELLGGLSLSTLKHGILIMSKKEPQSLIKLLDGQCDIELSDAILQYSILGIKITKQQSA